MKVFSAIVLCGLMLLSSSPHLTYLLIYKSFQKKITRDFCINKNKPNSCCEGSCHLAKVEKKSEDNPVAPFSSAFKFREVEWVKQKLCLVVLQLPQSAALQQNTCIYNAPVFSGYTTTLFHPPCC
ncbi:MAG TPA: hypothetical protein PKO18_06280 [Chitinophagales bacterium]|nr:hypothetical protein [Chitinophagales bacterium]HNL84825.1 hypothetical protein [Chitinophagales bacterium]